METLSIKFIDSANFSQMRNDDMENVIVIVHSLSVELQRDTWYFWHKKIWLLLARQNGFLSIIGLSPLFLANDFSGRRFSPSGIFIPPPFYVDRARKGLFDPETVSNNLPSYSLFLWHRLASRINALLTISSQKLHTNRMRNVHHYSFSSTCYPRGD